MLLRADDQTFFNDARVTQPLCTILQVALVDLLTLWELKPMAVVGHSSGEIAAAYCAGALSKASAYKVAYFRGALSSELSRFKHSKGSMLAVALSEYNVQVYLDEVSSLWGSGRLVVGCVNSPQNVTLSGEEICIDFIKGRLDEDNVFVRKLQVPVAYHSTQMEKVSEKYTTLIQDISAPSRSKSDVAPPTFFSSVKGEAIDVTELSSPQYWARNMVSQVKFGSALTALLGSLSQEKPGQTDNASVVLVEVGPHSALRRPVHETMEGGTYSAEIFYESLLRINTNASKAALELIGKLHCYGFQTKIAAANEPLWPIPASNLQPLVDLPSYPFDHSQSYWLESRISRNFRFAEVPRHELLGSRTVEWNALDARWRNTIRFSELPWIQDHCFNGTMLYPAAGILVMAIEAARQLANPDLHNDVVLTGYSFESVSFHRPLLVNLTSEGVETQFSLRPTGRKVPRSDRYTFHLYQATQDGWAVICDGTISTEYGRKGERESDENVFPQDDWLPVARRCKQNVDPRDAYENLATYGFAFGPTFQALSNIQHNQIKEATAILDPRQWLEKVEPGQAGADHVIHPTSLDAFMHLAAIAESDGSWTPIPTLVPSKLEQLWISNDLLSHNPGQRLQVLTRPTFHGYRDYESSSAAYDTQTKRCQIFQQGYRFTTITELEPLDSSERPFAYDVSWKPDIDLLSENELATVCENAASKSSDKYDLAILDHVELLCLSYMRDACQKLDQIGFAGDTKQSTRYIAWMKKMIQEHEAQTFSTDCQHAEIPSAAVSLAEIISRGGGGPEMDLMQMVGEDLPRLLTGETDVLELLFGDDNRAEAFYQGDGWAMITAKVAAYIDLVAHRDPQIQILEVGAGTGGCTAAILDELAICSNGETGRPRIGKYTYTDISPSFFDSASQRFHKYTDQMDFRVFDMEKDPLSQGYDLNSYDVIVAHAAVHATSNIESSLRHLQSLLKPNGKIVISEPCNLNRARVPFVFGLLPGWWLGTEEYRFWTPLLSEERWDYEFRKAGFGGTELCLKDFDGNNHTASVLVSSKLMPSTAVDTEEPHPSPVINQFLVVVADQNGLGHPLVSALKSSIEPLEIQTETCVYSSLSSRDLEGTFVISLLELEKPFLVDIGEDDWEVLQTIVRSVSGIMWITKGREENAELGMVTGLLRVLLSEYPHLQFLEFALEATSTNVSAADNFYKILRKSLRSGSLDKKECEYEERSGIVHVSRLVESKHLNNHMDSRMNVQRPQTRELGLPSTGNLSLSIRKPGFLDSLFFQEAATCKTRDLQGDQVEVEVKAVGLGFRDCLIAQGQLPASSMGLEFAGVITAIGPDVSETEFSPGDSVCGLSLGAFSTTICTRATLLLRVPENMSFSEAASGVLGCTLAYHSLVTLANLKRGEKVLIHSGAGAVGQMALQIANDIEVEVYTTVGNEDKKTFITSAFGVSEDRVIVGRGVSLVPELEKLSGTMDVVLNSLTGEGLRHSLKCLCPFGRLIDISVQDNRALGDLPGSLFTSGITYSKVDLTLMLDHPNVAFKETLAAVQRMILDGNASPFPTAAFSASHIEAAFSTIYEAESPGKVVVELGRGDSVSVVPSTAQSLYFRADSSYVIAGGLGGIGKSTVKWMADRGARYLIILSRSGAKEASAIDLIEELGEHGVVVAAPKCDITDRDFLSSVLNECAQSMPPIRGCIQGAMVLEVCCRTLSLPRILLTLEQDTIFDSMSVADFHKAVRPKVQGSWNLHNLLPSDLDFFIMLSSAGGIMGTRGQSNYASGSTYQDSLARYRASHGLTAASVDLGLIRGVGFAAEHRDSLISISKVRFRSISEKEYLAMMEHLCEPQRNIANEPLLSQVVTGVELPEFLKSGKDRESGSEDDKDSSWAWMRWVSRPMFSSLGAQKEHKSQNARTRNKSGGEYDTSIEFREQFAAIKHSQAEAANLVAKTLKSKLTRTLRMPEEDIETQKNVFYYGVDSLVAVDLRHWISNDMKASLSVFEIMESTIGSLSWQIVERSEL